MRRIAAHYVWYKQVLRLHYVELDDEGRFRGVFPLTEEIAGTEFYDGVLIPVPASLFDADYSLLANGWQGLTGELSLGDAALVYRLSGLSLAAAKLGTDDSGGNGHVQRF